MSSKWIVAGLGTAIAFLWITSIDDIPIDWKQREKAKLALKSVEIRPTNDISRGLIEDAQEWIRLGDLKSAKVDLDSAVLVNGPIEIR